MCWPARTGTFLRSAKVRWRTRTAGRMNCYKFRIMRRCRSVRKKTWRSWRRWCRRNWSVVRNFIDESCPFVFVFCLFCVVVYRLLFRGEFRKNILNIKSLQTGRWPVDEEKNLVWVSSHLGGLETFESFFISLGCSIFWNLHFFMKNIKLLVDECWRESIVLISWDNSNVLVRTIADTSLLCM